VRHGFSSGVTLAIFNQSSAGRMKDDRFELLEVSLI